MAERTATNRVSLTNSFLAKATCPAGKDRVYFYDKKTPGLALCVTEAGGKTFYLIRRIGGRPERIRLGRSSDISIAGARKKAAIANSQVAEGGDPRALLRTSRGAATFGELFAMFIEGYAKLRKRTWGQDQGQFERYLSHWASLKLSQIRKAEVVALHNSLGRDRPYAANRVLALIRTVFNKASEQVGWQGPNPAAGIKNFPEKSRERFLTAKELPRFFDALAQETDKYRDFFMLALLTGARRGNLSAMRWDQIDFERSVWRIPDTKSGDSLTIPLCMAARRILQERKQHSDPECPWVFPSRRGKSGHLTDAKEPWQRILNRAGLKDLRIHDLRRTLGSWQVATGSSMPVIARTLGHKHQRATAVYARLDLDPVRAAVTRATDALLTAGGWDAAEGLPAEETKQLPTEGGESE